MFKLVIPVKSEHGLSMQLRLIFYVAASQRAAPTMTLRNSWGFFRMGRAWVHCSSN